MTVSVYPWGKYLDARMRASTDSLSEPGRADVCTSLIIVVRALTYAYSSWTPPTTQGAGLGCGERARPEIPPQRLSTPLFR